MQTFKIHVENLTLTKFLQHCNISEFVSNIV